jgi:hypothetical protein
VPHLLTEMQVQAGKQAQTEVQVVVLIEVVMQEQE